MAGFNRPNISNYPSIYHTFEARDLHSNKLIQYRVEDFPRQRIEEGIQFMVQNFFEHEVIGKTRKVKSDRVAVEEISQFWRESLSKGYSIVCFRENSDDIIGMNVLEVVSIDDPKSSLNFKSQNMRDFFNVMNHAQEQFNSFEHYNVKNYLIAYGLCTDPVYRARGIATEMLKARAPILKALGLKVTTTSFTGIGSQKAALKAGYEENFAVTYDYLYKMNSDFHFPGITSTHFKTMSLTI